MHIFHVQTQPNQDLHLGELQPSGSVPTHFSQKFCGRALCVALSQQALAKRQDCTCPNGQSVNVMRKYGNTQLDKWQQHLRMHMDLKRDKRGDVSGIHPEKTMIFCAMFCDVF